MVPIFVRIPNLGFEFLCLPLLLFWGAEHYTLDPYGFLCNLAVRDRIGKAVAAPLFFLGFEFEAIGS